MQFLWQDLFVLHALIGIFIVLWSLLETYLPRASFSRSQVGSGAALGLITVVTIGMAVEVQPGFHFDLRHALISVSGLLFGPISAIVTGLMAAVMRIYQGGGGWIAGLMGIGLATLIGASAHLLFRGKSPNFPKSVMFALAVSFAVLLALQVIPAEVRSSIIQKVWLPLMTLTFTSTLFTSFILSTELARRRDHRELQLYREMVDALPDCLNAKDLDGKFILANTATAKLMKARDAADLIGKSDFDFYPETVAAGFRDHERAILKSGEPQRIEQLVDFKDGKVGWVDTLKVPFHNKDGDLTALITYNRDSTEAHELNEMKEHFISTISHEIRTPLTSICGALGLLNHGALGELPSKAAELIDMADRNAQHLKELVNNVLDLEKLQAGQMDFTPESVSVSCLVNETLQSMKHFLPHKELSWTVTDEAPGAKVYAHPVRLRQILLNLMSNAAKFSPNSSKIELEITVVGEAVRFCVLDAGPGVDPEFEPVLFTRFRQDAAAAKLNTKNGTGLGLSLIKSFVEHMSGTVSYRRRGNRTEFRVEMPARTDKDAAGGKASLPSNPEETRDRILKVA